MNDVSTLAESDLRRYWRQFDLNNADAVRDGLRDVLPGLIGSYYLTAATVSADWYDLMRANAGVGRRFQAVIPEAPDEGRADALAGWAVSPLYASDPAVLVALSKVIGGLTRTVQDGGRQTIVASTQADPARVGWVRVGEGNCDFCRMLIGRGAVYSSDTADFASHDHCHCSAVPEFD